MNQVYCGTYKKLDFIEPFDYSDYKSCKNMPYVAALSAYRGTPLCGAIMILASQVSLPHKYVDIKVHKLNKMEIPCMPGWHLDRVHRHESEYALMVAGNSLTEFNYASYETDLDKPMTEVNQDLIAQLPESNVFCAKSWEPIHYTNLMPHRGAPTKTSGTRLLIRVVATTHSKVRETPDFKPGIYR